MTPEPPPPESHFGHTHFDHFDHTVVERGVASGHSNITPYPHGDAADAARGAPVWRPRRADVRAALLVACAMTVLGLVVGVLWYLLAPRLGFRLDPAGNAVPDGAAESEALIGADGWFVLLTAVTGLVAGAGTWTWRAVRGPVLAVALAAGGLFGALLASWIGHRLGHGPSSAELHQVGRLIQLPLQLRGKAALVVEPFSAVLAYVVLTACARDDDLGRRD